MSSAGRSGMSDTERTNLPGGRGNPTGMPPDMSTASGVGGPLMPGDDAPIDQVEVVEFLEIEDGTDDTFDMGPAGFRWWYVPAIGLPLGIGAGAAIWYLAKGEEPYLNAWELVTRPVRNLTRQPNLRATTKKAARKASITSDTLRDRVADALGGFDASDLAEKAGDLWEDARDSMADLWDQITDRDTLSQVRGTAGDARDATRRQFGKMAGNIAAAGTALAIQKKASDLAGAARAKTKATRAAAQDMARRATAGNAVSPGKAALGLGAKGGAWLAKNRAQAKANDLQDKATSLQRRGRFWMARNRAQSKASDLASTASDLKQSAKAAKARSARAAKKTRRRVTSPFRRMGTFALAALITAMVIYIRSWYSRRSGTTNMAGGIGAEDMRETASGRMEPDTWPRFAGSMPDATAPTATNSPTEPS